MILDWILITLPVEVVVAVVVGVVVRVSAVVVALVSSINENNLERCILCVTRLYRVIQLN